MYRLTTWARENWRSKTRNCSCSRKSPPVITDEIQYAPELFPYIKIYADENRANKEPFWLTGSQKYRLMQGVQESLAGRIGILDLMGLVRHERVYVHHTGT
jgi:predicted AAA+ superfamily ATPase